MFRLTPSRLLPRQPPPRPARASPTRATAVGAAASSTATAPPVAATGEWDGMLVSFNAAGEAQELPPAYVPDAYKEWGVAVCDWQTQSSVCVEEGGLRCRLRRLLPSVGCEADATAFVDAATVATPSFLASTPDGAYCAPAPTADAAAVVEACLPLPPASDAAAAPSDRRRLRFRIVLGAGRADGPASVGLASVEQMSEKYDSPYVRDGASLSGCGGGVPAFSGRARLEAGALDGSRWAAAEGGASFGVAAGGGLAPTGSPPAPDAARGGAQGRLLLPLDAWVAVRAGGEGGGVAVEAGVIVDGGAARRVAVARYGEDGRLAGVDLVVEARA